MLYPTAIAYQAQLQNECSPEACGSVLYEGLACRASFPLAGFPPARDLAFGARLLSVPAESDAANVGLTDPQANAPVGSREIENVRD